MNVMIDLKTLFFDRIGYRTSGADRLSDTINTEVVNFHGSHNQYSGGCGNYHRPGSQAQQRRGRDHWRCFRIRGVAVEGRQGRSEYFLCDLFCNKSGRSCEEGWFEGVDANRKSPQGGQVRLLVKGMKGV